MVKYNVLYIAVTVVLAGLAMFGCSERIVDQGSSLNSAVVRIDAPAALSTGIAPYAHIRISGPDMPSMLVPLSLDSVTNRWSGELSVPSGIDREFVLEAIDTMYGEGSFPDSEIVLYRASDTADLIANQTVTIDFTLFPTVPLLTTTPSEVRCAIGDTFSVILALYHGPHNLYGMACQVYYPTTFVIADSVQFFSAAADSIIEFASVDRANPYVSISVTETNTTQTLWPGTSYAKVAKIFFRTTVGNAGSGLIWVSSTSMQDANQQSIYPSNFYTGYTNVFTTAAQ